MAAEQLHRDLTILSHKLTISDDLLAKGKEYMQKMFLFLQKKSKYNLDRCRLLGGVGKKTSISIKFDYDCVIYVNDVDPPFKKLLDEWDDILTLNLSENIKTKVKKHSVQVIIDGFKFDMLPAPNYAGPNHDILLQAKRIWKIIYDDENAGKKENISYLYSSALSELAVLFMQKQSGFIHDICRLAKFWNCTILFEEYVSGRSCIVEYLAVKAGQEEEQAATNGELSMLRAFRRFLCSMIKFEQIGIMFLDYYQEKVAPACKKPYLIDPTNPYNNFLANTSDRFLPALRKYSQETWERLEKCERNFVMEFEKLFDPQPDLRRLFKDNINANSVTTMIGSYENCDEKLPKLIERRETFDSATLEKVKDFMSSVLKHLSTTFNGKSDEDIAKKIPKATERFIDRSFYKNDNQWVPTISKHEDYDITFILPLNTKNHHAVYISMSK